MKHENLNTEIYVYMMGIFNLNILLRFVHKMRGKPVVKAPGKKKI